MKFESGNGVMSYQTELRNKNRGYMNLIVWQKAGAAQSIASNISEGYGRRSVKEYIQYLYIALGSAAETMSRAVGLNRTGQISDSRIREFDLLHYEVENRLLKLVEKLEAKRDEGDWVARINEEEYCSSSLLQHSSTPTLYSSSL